MWAEAEEQHQQSEATIRSLRAALAAAEAERDAARSRLAEAVGHERMRCLEWIRRKWRFDHQNHTHTWHDFADCIAAIQDGTEPPIPWDSPKKPAKPRAAAIVSVERKLCGG